MIYHDLSLLNPFSVSEWSLRISPLPHLIQWGSDLKAQPKARQRPGPDVEKGTFLGVPYLKYQISWLSYIYIISYFWFCYAQFMVGGFGGTIFETNPHWDSTSHHGVKRCWTLLDILGNSSWEQETPLVYLARFLLKDYIMMYTMIHI